MQGKGWVAAQDLKPNDKLELRDGEDAFVDAVRYEKLDKPIPVFNFEVEGFHTYFVGTSCVLVHNMCAQNPKSPKKLSDNALKKVDVHAFKEDYVGRQVSRYDVYNDTSTDLLSLGTKRADNWVETGLNLGDALKYYPKQGGIK